MRYNRKASKLVLLGLALLFTVASVSAAASLKIDSGDKEIWRGEEDTTLNGYANCTKGSTSVELVYPKGGGKTIANTDGDFSTSVSPSSLGYGDYSVKLLCGDSQAANVAGKMLELSVKRVEPPETIEKYTGEKLTVKLDAEINGSSSQQVKQSNSQVDLSFNSWGSLDVSDKGLDAKGNRWFEVTVPKDLEPGTYTLLTDLSYSGGLISDGSVSASPANGPAQVKVRNKWAVDVVNTSEKSIQFEQLSSLFVNAEITYKNDSTYARDNTVLGPSDFEASLTSANGNVSYDIGMSVEPLDNDRILHLEVDRKPSNIPLGRYNLVIDLKRGGGLEVANFTVSKYILFSGKITDATGQPVNGKIYVEKEGFSEEIEVKHGTYSGNVLPGIYNFTLQLPEVTVHLQGVRLQTQADARGTIRYDDIALNEVGQNLEGVTVANALAVWFGYPFREGEITMQYDTTKVNPSNLKVYECVGWNINGVSCYSSSEWKSVGVKRGWIHPTVGTVTFPVTPYNVTGKPQLLNGYMVVKNTPLQLDYVEFSSDKVKKGGTLTVNGKLVTPSGKGVSGARVSASIVNLNGKVVVGSSSTTTNQAGLFSIKKTVPGKEGEYHVRIHAEKKPYSPLTRTIQKTFSTYTLKKISLSGPETAKFYVGGSSTTQFTIINSGQAPLKDVTLSLKGFKRGVYSFRKKEWSKLGPDGSVKALMTTRLPADFCKTSCQKYRTLTVEVTATAAGQKINDMITFQAQVSKETPPKKVSVDNASGNKGTGFSFKMPNTGQFLKRQGSVNIALGLIIVFTLVLATAIKRKNSDDDRGSRPVMSGSGGRGGGMRKQKPEVGNSEESEEESEEEPRQDGEESDGEEDSSDEKEMNGEGGEEDGDDAEGFECSVCGEKFDTESARDLHEQAIH
ncbi:MAG: hypothetical protein ABEJ75_01815 [Candidatus Nanohaloarchaea archaeon]